MDRLLWAVGPLAGIVFLAAACGEDAPNAGAPSQSQPSPAGSEVTVVGQNTSFDTTSLDATVGEELTITSDNRDDRTNTTCTSGTSRQATSASTSPRAPTPRPSP